MVILSRKVSYLTLASINVFRIEDLEVITDLPQAQCREVSTLTNAIWLNNYPVGLLVFFHCFSATETFKSKSAQHHLAYEQ
jgi:hypothetical protein